MIWVMEILKDLNRKQLLIKYYLRKHLILLKIQIIMDFNVEMFQWFILFLIKKTSVGAIKKEIMQNGELAKELQKLLIRKFEKRKVHSSVINNIWGAYLADMQLLSKFNKGFRFLLF